MSGAATKRTTRKRAVSAVVATDDSASSASKRAAPRSAYNSLQEGNLNALLRDGRYSDLVLKCGGERLKVHKSVLCPQSEFFEACVESGMKESVEGEIQLVDEELGDVKKMLEFLYTGDFWEHKEQPEDMTFRQSKWEAAYRGYRDPAHERTEEEKHDDPLIACIRLYGIANKLGIPGLRKAVINKMNAYTNLMLHVVYYGQALELKARVRNIVGQWQRLMDALEFCFTELDGQQYLNDLADVLITPLALVAPLLYDLSGKRYKMQNGYTIPEESDLYFDDLQRRIGRNAAFGARLFRYTCRNSLQRQFYTEMNTNLMGRVEMKKDVEKMFAHIEKFFADPRKIASLRCETSLEQAHLPPDERLCTSTCPMVPAIGTDEHEYLGMAVFMCKECGLECPPDSFSPYGEEAP